MILQALEKVLADHCTSAEVRRIEAGGSPGPLWQRIEATGFLDLLLPEEQGGAALPLPELFPILECLGRFAMPLPIGQSMAARALIGAGAKLPQGMVTLATHLHRQDDGSIVCQRTPCGSVADYVLACDDGILVLLRCAGAQRQSEGDPRLLGASLSWSHSDTLVKLPGQGHELPAFAAALTAALLSGAMQRTFDMALDYCNQRVQFGKPLGKFQAIQQQLSVMAEHVLASAIAAESAFRGADAAPTWLASAVAKSRTSEAAGLVAATAHAVHGAIGMTDEYDLAILTRRLHDWRTAYGAENYWNELIGKQVLASSKSLADFVRAV